MKRAELELRDNEWLRQRLIEVWRRFFSDVQQTNKVSIHFGRRSISRLGSISMSDWQDKTKKIQPARIDTEPKGTSVITISGYFKDLRIPHYVVEATIGHELAHYVHGFHSPRPQLYRYPHQGDIVAKELRQRGLGSILKQQQAWLKKEWQFIIPHQPTKRRRKYVRLSFLSTY